MLASGLIVLAITALALCHGPRPIWSARILCRGPADLQGTLPILPRAKPTQEGFAAPPKGVLLETPEEIRARAAMINQQVWITRVMPPGNLTHMTDAERRLIARWFKGGAE